MLKALKTPELEVMGTGKGTVNVNPKRLNVEVYAPFVEFAIMELEQARCYASQMVKETAQTQEQYDGMCDCYTEELGRSVRQTAVPQLSAIAEEPQGVTDPVNDIMNSYNHMRERHQILKACVDRYDPRKQH
jgi:hypothetical protein